MGNHEIEWEEDEELIHFEDDQDEDEDEDEIESEALDSEDRGESRESARIVPALQDRPSADTDESETDEQEEEEPMIFANAYGTCTRSGDEYDLPVEDDEARPRTVRKIKKVRGINADVTSVDSFPMPCHAWLCLCDSHPRYFGHIFKIIHQIHNV